jgi:hypothetical protein
MFMPITKTDIIGGSVCIVALNADEAQAALDDLLDGDGSPVPNLFSTSDDAQAYLEANPRAGARVYSATLDIRPLNA